MFSFRVGCKDSRLTCDPFSSQGSHSWMSKEPTLPTVISPNNHCSAFHPNLHPNSRWPPTQAPDLRPLSLAPPPEPTLGPWHWGSSSQPYTLVPQLSSEHVQQKGSWASRDQYINRNVRLNINRGRLRGGGQGANWALEGKEPDGHVWETAELHPESTSPALSP